MRTGAATELYISSLRAWWTQILHEPHRVMLMSLVFVVLSLPVVTVGIAAAVCLSMARLDAEGKAIRPTEFFSVHLRPVLLKAFLMGAIDLLFSLPTALCIAALFDSRSGNGIRMLYAVYLVLDALILASLIYRYPILIYNHGFTLREVFKRGTLILVANLIPCVLFVLMIMTILICSALTGVGLVLILPGCISFLLIHIYRQTLKAAQVSKST